MLREQRKRVRPEHHAADQPAENGRKLQLCHKFSEEEGQRERQNPAEKIKSCHNDSFLLSGENSIQKD